MFYQRRARSNSRNIGDKDLLVGAPHAILLAGDFLEGLAVGMQLLELCLVDVCRVLVVLNLGFQVVNLLLVAIDAHVVVLTEEQQHEDENDKDDEWQVEPSRDPFGTLKLSHI